MRSEQRQDLSPPGCRISLKPFWWPTSCGSHGGCSCTWGFLGLWVAPLTSANPAPPRSCRDFPPNLTPPNSAGFLLFPLSFPPHTLLLNTLRFWRGELSILHLSLTAEVHTDCIQHGWAPDLALTEEMLPHRVPGSSWWWGMLLAPPTAHPGSSWSSGRGSAWSLGCCLAVAHSSVHLWHVQLVLQEVNGRLAFHIKHNCIILPFTFTKRLVLFTWDYYYYFCFNAFFFYDLWYYLWRIRRKNIYL